MDATHDLEELRTNESLALSVERIWFLQTELRPRIAVVKRNLDLCACSLSLRQSARLSFSPTFCSSLPPPPNKASEAIPLIPFEVDGGAFAGFVGVDGCFVCKGEFSVRRPLPHLSSLQSPSVSPAPFSSGGSGSSGSTFVTALASENALTLVQVQDSHNLVRTAAELLAGVSRAPSAPETKWAAPDEISQALELTVRAWEMLTHPPVDALFPNSRAATQGSSYARMFEPPLAEDVLIEAAVASGEAIVHAYVLRPVVPPAASSSPSSPSSSGMERKPLFSKLESTGSVQIGGSWFKTLCVSFMVLGLA